MELSQLKKDIHAYVDGLDDEKALLAVAEVLEKYGQPVVEKRDYEQSVEFKAELAQALAEADQGEFHSHGESMDWLENRSWRTR
jgi:predicted transcriptional regulator